MGIWVTVTVFIAVVSYIIGEFNGRVNERERMEEGAE